MDEETHKGFDLEKTIEYFHAMHKKDRNLIKVLSLGIAIIAMAGMLVYFLFVKEIKEIKITQEGQYKENLVTNQFLMSTIDWATVRTKTILYMRDKIIEEWMRTKRTLDFEDAYKIAETNMKECENFPYIHPFIVLSMQNVESSFSKNAISKTGAKGLNQIMPSTGRLICTSFGWSYSDSLLYDIQNSTHMAVKLIDVCWSQYHDWSLVLADYNGGPYQAYYYKNEKAKLAEETKNYVPSVMDKVKYYTEGFKTYRVDSKLTSCKIDTVRGH
jgi:hypothetical protein